MTSTTRSEITRPAELSNLALLDANGLVLIQYTSIYGYAFEVLTQNGQQRISHGNDREAVIKKAIEYLEARAVLDGKPMKAPGGEYTKSDRIEAFQYAAIAKQRLAEEVMTMEQVRAKALIDARNISQFFAYDSNSPTGTVVLGHIPEAGRALPGPEPEKKV